MSDDFYVDLPLFLTFNKVKSLTQELKLLQYAVRNSPFLGLSPDGLRVKRTLYYPKKENELDCIVYVDHLARNTTVDWIWEYFEQFGVVEFVSLPRYKDSHRCRGFAFIEFDTPESAVNAVEAHSPTGNPDISACTNYSNLDSLERSFNEEVHNVPDSSCHVDNENSPLGDRLHLPQDSNSVSNVTTTTADASAVVASEAECTDESQKASPKNLDHGIPRNEDLDVATPAERHQLQRRNSKTSRPLEKRKRSLLKRKTTDADHTDHLLVLPKRVWLQRREAYLAEQKKRLSMCKKIMKADRLQQEALKIDFDVPKPRKQMPVKNPGCVVRVTLDQPIEEKSSIISGVKAFCGSGVEFVDCSVGEKVFHVRFGSREGAHSFRYGSSWKNKSTIIEGAEEDVFWQRVQSCWIARITGPRIRKKVRGKQKVISRWRARQEALEGIGGEDGLPDHNNDQE
ncbi:hypothetical protein HAZT_HAZT011467 [Hyalella azteca]|nr:hypothetical protein HAZT_HAZT011467 [Hyalella azteca]